MLPSLPGPGSPPFVELVKGLHPFGISPSKVTLDSPSTRLGDLFLTIGLLDDRLTVRIASGSLELFVRELFVGDEEKLVPIADVLFVALTAIDSEANLGTANLRASSHLKVVSGDVEKLLSEHAKFSESVSALIPDAIVYKVNPGDESKAKELRVVIAKSLTYSDAIFMDISADYEGPVTPAELAERMNADADRIMAMLSLKEQEEISQS
jgi:hypothetical protein